MWADQLMVPYLCGFTERKPVSTLIKVVGRVPLEGNVCIFMPSQMELELNLTSHESSLALKEISGSELFKSFVTWVVLGYQVFNNGHLGFNAGLVFNLFLISTVHEQRAPVGFHRRARAALGRSAAVLC